jgi:hypothetical protein
MRRPGLLSAGQLGVSTPSYEQCHVKSQEMGYGSYSGLT